MCGEEGWWISALQSALELGKVHDFVLFSSSDSRCPFMVVVFAFIPEFGQSKRLPCHVSSLWIVLFCDLGWIPGAVYSMIT